MTANELLAHASLALNDTNNAFWTKDSLLMLAQRAYDDILRITKSFHTGETHTWDSNAMGAGFISTDKIFEITHVLWNTEVLDRKTPAEMNATNQYWNSYPSEDEPLYWIQLSPRIVAPWPRPEVTGSLVVYGYSLDPVALTYNPGPGESDLGPSKLPDALHYTIVDMVVESALRSRYGSPGHLQASTLTNQDVAAGLSNASDIVSGTGGLNA